MENVRKHVDVRLVHTAKKLKKVTAKPTYKSCQIFSNDLVGIELTRAKVLLNKPSYCGMAILDLSKYAMYDFYYNYLKKKYGDKIQLQMTDTDSFLYHVQTDDLYADMKENLHLFDTANYPKDHFLYSKVNDKRLNKMKDETQSVPISKFVGLRLKMYAYVCGGKKDKRAKGISKVTVKNNLSYQMYEETLFVL